MVNQYSWQRKLACLLTLLTAVVFLPCAASAATKEKEEAAETVDLFEAVKNGQVETKYVAQNANRGNLLVKNLTNKPINVRVPDAFGAVQVLAQFGGGGMGGMGGGMGGMGGGMGGMGGGGGGGQAMGGGGMGGMGGGMGGGGMGGMGGGMFRVAPEKTTKIVSNTVCLEHGKTDPTSVMSYNIVPIENVATDPRVVELCRMLAKGEVPTNVAQAAAWHLANGLTWEKLASLDRIRSKYTGNVKYFNYAELQMAHGVVAQIERRVGSSDKYQKPYPKNDGNVSYSSASAQSAVQISGNGTAAGFAGAAVGIQK